MRGSFRYGKEYKTMLVRDDHVIGLPVGGARKLLVDVELVPHIRPKRFLERTKPRLVISPVIET